VINSFPETPIEVQATFDYDEDASELADRINKKKMNQSKSINSFINNAQHKVNFAIILTSEGTTGVPAGAAGIGGTGGASGTLPATTAASKSESLALTVKRHGGRRRLDEEKLK
jgi:hypothetical protein